MENHINTDFTIQTDLAEALELGILNPYQLDFTLVDVEDENE